jgi:hypothetical protein
LVEVIHNKLFNRVLGFPLGNASFTEHYLAKIAASIIEDLPKIAILDDGMIYFQILRACVNARLPFFLRGVRYDRTINHARQVDAAILKAFGTYCSFRDGFETDPAYADACIQFRAPLTCGGLGVTPAEVKAAAAFYSAQSHAIKFAANTRFAPVASFVASDDFEETAFFKDYVMARNFLLNAGAVSADAIPAEAFNKHDRINLEWRNSHPILPTIDNLIGGDRPVSDDISKTTFVPDQSSLTRIVLNNTPQFTLRESLTKLTDPGKRRMEHMSKREFKSFRDDCPFYHAHKFKKNHKLRHSPNQFLASTHSMLDPFRKDMWTVWVAYVLGTPMPQCLQPLGMHGAYQPCRCNGHPTPDAAGHHKMNCTFSSKSAGHQHVEDTFAKAARSACVECTTSKTQVPTHLDSNKQGDALINLSKNADASQDWKNVLDFTIVHPFSATGEFKYSATTMTYNKKMQKHG